jgi:hypothetical protein
MTWPVMVCSSTRHIDPRPGARTTRHCPCGQYAWVPPVPMLRNPHPTAFGRVLAIRRTDSAGDPLG